MPDVKAQLLSLSDMPAGWSVDNSPDGGGSEPACFQKVKSVASADKAKADAKFQDGSNGVPFFEEDLVFQPGHAQETMAKFAQLMSGCGQVTLSSGGYKFSGTIGQMSFPSFGDQTEPYQLNLSTVANGLHVTFGIDLVAIRQGDEIAVLFFGDLGTPDVAELQQFATTAASKIKAA